MKYLTDKEAAVLLGVSPGTLRNSRMKGRLLGAPAPHYFKMGHRVRYSEEEIKAWLNGFKVFNRTKDSNDYVRKLNE